MTNKKVILDVDTGIDDAMAIAYAIAAPGLDLIGVVSSYGNLAVHGAAINSLKILELLGRSDVPVFVGVDHALNETSFKRLPVSAQIHGENGIGDVDLPNPTQQPATKSAVDFIIEAAHQYQQDLVIIPTGALTNVATAIQKDPHIVNLIGNVTLMGGALTVQGNVSPFAEANINQDAVAANAVFTSPLHDTMVGLDVTLRTLLTKQETKQWRALGTNAGTKFADIVDYYIDVYAELYPHLGGCSLHDPLAVGVAEDPSLVQTLDLDIVVTTTPDTYGRTIGDNTRLADPHPSVSAAITVDTNRYLARFMNYLTTLFQAN